MNNNRVIVKSICTILIFSIINLSVHIYAYGKSTYNIDTNRKDSPSDFNLFLESCTQKELIQIAQSLRMLPDIEKSDFGKYGLNNYEYYANKVKESSALKPLRPSSFNDVSPDIALRALENGRIERELISVENIKLNIVWISSNTFSYPFKDKENVDYHTIVQWVAKKKGSSNEDVNSLPTFKLERKIVELYMAEIWDKLTPEQREELLNKLEKELGITIENKVGLITSTGIIAVTTLIASTYSILGAFTFYHVSMTFICSVGQLIGITFPFVVYTTAAKILPILTGPIGWTIFLTSVAAGLIFANMPYSDKVACFVMTVHNIKEQRLYGKSF